NLRHLHSFPTRRSSDLPCNRMTPITENASTKWVMRIAVLTRHLRATFAQNRAQALVPCPALKKKEGTVPSFTAFRRQLAARHDERRKPPSEPIRGNLAGVGRGRAYWIRTRPGRRRGQATRPSA